MEDKKYTVRFYMQNGEIDEEIGMHVDIKDIFPLIFSHLNENFPDWNWNDGNNGFAEIYRRNDGVTYIEINGIGNVWKGATHYSIKEET